MDNITPKYLKSLLRDTVRKHKKIRFSLPDETGAAITYIPSKRKIFFPGQRGGLDFRLQMEKSNTAESNKLRNGIKNYYRIVCRADQILRIDCFIDGKCDHIFLMHYDGKKRYAFPFLANGDRACGYIQVQEYNDQGGIIHEYLVRPTQLIYHTYSKCGDDTVQHSCIFYGPKIKDLQQNTIGGYYTLGNRLSYTETTRPLSLKHCNI